MEGLPKNQKDIITLIFVFILIIIGVIGCCLLFLKPKQETKKEEQNIKKQINNTIDDETIELLTSIVGIKDNDYINEIINSFANKDMSEIDDNTILDLFIYSSKPAEQVNDSLCSFGPNIETCNKYIKNEFIQFLKKYDFSNPFDYIMNSNDMFIYLRRDIKTIESYKHTYIAKYGYKDDDSTNYITLEDNISDVKKILNKTSQKYNYIFKKSTDDTKTSYYLIKVEKVD